MLQQLYYSSTAFGVLVIDRWWGFDRYFLASDDIFLYLSYFYLITKSSTLATIIQEKCIFFEFLNKYNIITKQINYNCCYLFKILLILNKIIWTMYIIVVIIIIIIRRSTSHYETMKTNLFIHVHDDCNLFT